MVKTSSGSARCRRWRWWACLAWALTHAAIAGPGEAPPRIDQDWRARYIWGVEAEIARNASRAWDRAQKAFDAASVQDDPRAKLHAAIFYFAARLKMDDDRDCSMIQTYTTMVRAGGKAFEPELFDLGIATVSLWGEQRCPGQITVDELDALAHRMGDPARMYFVLDVKANRASESDRFAEAVSLRIQQLDFAIAPFQKASALLWMADAMLTADRHNAEEGARWLERARLEFDPEEFQSLARRWEADYTVVEFRRGNADAALAHVRRLQRLLKLGAASSQNAAISLASCAKYLNRLHRGRDALELLEQSRSYGVDDTYTRLYITAQYLRAYAELRTPEAWAKGEQEVRQVNAWLEDMAQSPTARTEVLGAMADFYERFGRYELAVQARKKLEAAMLQAQRSANDTTRVELQEKLAVAFKDKENAQLKAEAELRDARQRGWIVAFGIAALGVLGAGGALAVALRQRQRLARVSAELEQRNGELEQRSASRIRLLAAACHDLRQPAHALGMLAELGSEARWEDTRFAAWLQSVRRSTASLGDMLDELMDLGRLDGGHYQPLLSEVPLGELMQEVMLHFGPLARRKGLTLEAPPVELTVVSDRHLLRRILFNLVSNAIKYTDAGVVRILVEPNGPGVRLTVQDTGPGIPQDKLEDVFRDYVRLNPLKAAEGLGIGLSIVRRAAELLGHELSLKSEPGEGTSIALSLPASASPAQDLAPTTAEATTAGAGTVVAVMEDDADVRDAMVALLQRWGYRVVPGPDADALLTQLAEQRTVPDLVITDLHLQGTNGLEAVDRVRAALQTPAMPALLVTGDLDDTVTRQAAQAQVFVAHKPLAPHQLARLIRQVLDTAEDPSQAEHSNTADPLRSIQIPT